MKSQIKRFLDYLGVPLYWPKQNICELRTMFVRIWAHSPAQRFRLQRILRRDVVRLNFGCGDTQYEGWRGIDQFYAAHVDLAIDLRGALPFPDASVDLCYSEHFLEHINPQEGQRHLNEVYRILKSHGRYRVVVPDVLKFAKSYLAHDFEFFHRAFPWASRPMEALYCVANWDGEHRNILDYDELAHMGRIAGFNAVVESRANASEIRDLRIDKSDPQRVEESLYVEFIKSAGPGICHGY